MAIKFLLVALSTTRVVDGEKRKVRFSAKSTPDLTADELKMLDDLTKSTGKLHYRDPINEGGAASVTASEPTVVETPDFAGQNVPMGEKSVDQLKAFLTFHEVEFKGNASKGDLLKLATEKQTAITDAISSGGGSGGGSNDDPDGGL